MFRVVKENDSELGRIISISFDHENGLADPYDAVTLAYFLNRSLKHKVVRLLSKKQKISKLKLWARVTRDKLPKCSRCLCVLRNISFTSKANPRYKFCSALCAKQDELDNPLNDNDETEFEV